jgi:hypothetical protein
LSTARTYGFGGSEGNHQPFRIRWVSSVTWS